MTTNFHLNEKRAARAKTQGHRIRVRRHFKQVGLLPEAQVVRERHRVASRSADIQRGVRLRAARPGERRAEAVRRQAALPQSVGFPGWVVRPPRWVVRRRMGEQAREVPPNRVERPTRAARRCKQAG
jgi:hypothetical protein